MKTATKPNDLTNVRPIDPGVRIGHVHLKVADLDRALNFYCGVLGFELTQRYGAEAAFVSAGGYHHHIGLNTSVASHKERPLRVCFGNHSSIHMGWGKVV